MSYIPKTLPPLGEARILMYAPGIAANPDIDLYADWADLMTRYAALTGTVIIVFNGDNIGANLPLPVGAYVFDKPTVFRTHNGIQQIIECPDGVTLDFQGRLFMEANVWFAKTTGADPTWTEDGSGVIVMGPGCGIGSAVLGVPFMELATGNQVHVYMYGDATLGAQYFAGGDEVIELVGNASLIIDMYDGSTCYHGFLKGAGGTDCTVNMFSPGITFTGKTPAMLGPITQASTMAFKKYRKNISLADIQGLGAVANGIIGVLNLPAGARILRNRIKNAGSAETHLASLTASLGHTTYVEQLVAASVQLANEVVQTNPVADFISGTAATHLYVRFVATGDTLDTAAGLGDGIDVEIDYVS